MEKKLYPLRFTPIIKEKIWGGSRLRDVLGKEASEKAGESWEISGVTGDISVVANGFLAGNNIQELVEVYMGDLVGDKIYEKFGLVFPLLIKYIDASEILSVQVHPDDELAKSRHNSFGKTEMWYIMESDNGEVISGFNRELDREKYLKHFNNGTLKEILNFEKPVPGEIYYIPSGRIHATGAGILLAEVQQTSDITYRIYDWDRVDDQGNSRELHTDLALDAIDFKYHARQTVPYKALENSTVTAVDSPYFNVGVISFDQLVEKDFNLIDSFVIYMCVEGSAAITYSGGMEMIKKGETILIPAELKNLAIIPAEHTTLLEIYIK